MRDREVKREAVSIKTSDTTADVTNRVFIMGYRIVIHIGSYELPERVENCGVFVEKFSNAKVRCMEDYIEPALREMPSHVILHVDTNDVTTKQDTQQISESIINLAVKIKRNCDVSTCSITTRNGKYLRKTADVNKRLKDRCPEKKYPFHKPWKPYNSRHLKVSKFHLYKKATKVLSNQLFPM